MLDVVGDRGRRHLSFCQVGMSVNSPEHVFRLSAAEAWPISAMETAARKTSLFIVRIR